MVVSIVGQNATLHLVRSAAEDSHNQPLCVVMQNVHVAADRRHSSLPRFCLSDFCFSKLLNVLELLDCSGPIRTHDSDPEAQ
jgi:hypothetical protein